MSGLNEADYDVLVLRFFQNKDFRAVGAAIGVSDDTAQKRVARALEKLHDLLSQRGIRTTAGALSLIIAANAVQAAPVGLAVSISAAALAGTTIATSTTAIAVTKTVAMTTMQKTIVTATVAILAGTGVYEAKQTASAHTQIQALRQQKSALSEQFLQLQHERDAMTNQLAELQAEKLHLQSNSNQTELLKLRGEAALLHQNADALEKLKEENLQLRSQLAGGTKSSSAKPPPEVAPQNLFPRESWAAAGYADPRAAFQSAILAVTKGDVEAYATSLSPDLLQAKQKEVSDRMALTGKSLADLATDTTQQYSTVTGYRILDQQSVADDEVVLRVYLDGVGVEKLIRMKKFGTDWKMDAAP